MATSSDKVPVPPKKGGGNIANILRPSQIKFFDALWHGKERLLLIGRRRLGKTRFAVIFLNLYLYYATGILTHANMYPHMRSKTMDALVHRWQSRVERETRALYLLPGENQANSVLATEFRGSLLSLYREFPKLEKFPLDYVASKGTASLDLRQYNKGIHEWRHRGIKRHANDSRGTGHEVIVVDEVADQNMLDLKAIVTPMLADTDGILLMTGTAKANAMTQDVIDDYNKSPSKKVISISVKDSQAMGEISYSQIAKIVEDDFGGDWENPIFLQEWMCRHDVPVEGAILERWASEIKTPLENSRIFASIDLGYTDACVILFWRACQDGLMLIGGHKYEKWHTEEITADLAKRYKRGGKPMIHTLYIPQDGFAQSRRSQDTDAQTFDKGGFAKYISRVKRPNSNEAHIRAILKYMPRIFIAEDLPDWIMIDLRNWRFDPRKGDVPIHDKFSHTGDAFRYGVYSIFNDEDMVTKEIVKKEDKSPLQEAIDKLHDDDKKIDDGWDEWKPDADELFWQP